MSEVYWFVVRPYLGVLAAIMCSNLFKLLISLQLQVFFYSGINTPSCTTTVFFFFTYYGAERPNSLIFEGITVHVMSFLRFLFMVCDGCIICRYPLIHALQHMIELIMAQTRWHKDQDQLVSDRRHTHDTHGPARFQFDF